MEVIQKVLLYVTVEISALLHWERGQLSQLLRDLYKHDLCKMNSFYRCILPMSADYNPQLSIPVFLKTIMK